MTRAVAILVAVALALPSLTTAAFERPWPDARSAALCVDGRWVLARLRHGDCEASGFSVRADAGELYGLRELRGGALSVERGAGRLRLSLDVRQLGTDVIAEREAGVGVGVLSDGAYVRLDVRALEFAAAGYGAERACAFDLEASGRVAGLLSGGVSMSNLAGARLSRARLPQSITAGLALSGDDAGGHATIRVEDGFETSLACGAEVRLGAWVTARCGAETSPRRVAAGLGIGSPASPLPVLDIAWQWHPRLGASSFVSITWRL